MKDSPVVSDKQLVDVVRDWRTRARSVRQLGDGERAEVRGLVRELYDSRRWKPVPESRVVFSPSPFVTVVAAGLLAVYWSSRKTSRSPLKSRPDSEILRMIFGKIANKSVETSCSLIYDQVNQSCRQLSYMISSAVEVGSDLVADVVDEGEPILKYLAGAVRNPRVFESLVETCRSCSEADINEFRAKSVVDDLGLRDTVEMIGNVFDSIVGGNLCVGTDAVVDYLAQQGHAMDRDLVLRAKMASLAGPWVMHPEFCIVSAMPEVLKVDQAGHMHSGDGPACRWKDGTRLYYLDGVRVGSKFVEDPESTTAVHLSKMTTAQLKVCFDKSPKREQVLYAIQRMKD